jgi:Holliday junction resolvase RusA-like endonuclease
MTLTIILPLPHQDLRVNRVSKIYHLRRAELTKKARRDAGYATLHAINLARLDKPMWKTATTKCRFYFAVEKRRDKDNLIGWLKAYFDGIADAKLIENDCGLTHLPPEEFIDKKSPRVEIEVTTAD